MDIMDGTIADFLRGDGKGKIPLEDQKKLVKLYQTLDKIELVHGDSNFPNLMYKNLGGGKRKWRLIDFGRSRKFLSTDFGKNENMRMLNRSLFTGYSNVSEIIKERPKYIVDTLKSLKINS